jgi:hypothetical protein
MTCRIATRFVLGVVLAGAAACADSTSPADGVTDASLTLDAGADVADVTTQDLSEMFSGELLAGLAMTAEALPAPRSGCAFSTSTGRFVCPPFVSFDGVTITRSFGIYAGGAAQSSYDAAATDSLNFEASLLGSLSREGRVVWLNTTRSMTVSGLAGAETARTWNGLGTRSDSAHITTDGVARRTHVRSTDRISSVVFALPRAANPFPKSGSITHDIQLSSTADNGSGSRTRSATRHVVVTFNGTRVASVLVGTTPCALDLVTKRISCR